MTCDLGLGDDEAADGDDSDVKDNNGKEGWLRWVSHSFSAAICPHLLNVLVKKNLVEDSYY